MDTAQARAIVAMLVAAFPQATLEPESVNVYTAAIAELDNAQACLDAARAIVKHSKNFPAISEIRDTYLRAVEHHRLIAESEQHRIMPPHGQPPTAEAAAALRKLAEAWKLPALADFADRHTPTSDRAIPS